MQSMILVVIPCVVYALTWWSTGWGLSPDGTFYLRMAGKERVPMPYARRVLLPWILGERPRRWQAWSVAMMVLSVWLTAQYAGGSFMHKILAELLIMGLPGFWRFNVRFPILVDPTAFCAALTGAILLRSDHVTLKVLGVVIVAMGALVKETVPLFAAVFAMSVAPLLTLSIPLLLHLHTKRNDRPQEVWLKHPVREARKVHDFLDVIAKVFPWGALAVLALFSHGTWTLAATLALILGYSQCFIAQDNARLYQWAAPAVIAAVLQQPPGWVWAAAILGMFNPYRGT